MASRLINFALYQTGWFCCVLGAAKGHPWFGAAAALILLIVHLALVKEFRREIVLVLSAALIGGAIDSLQSYFGLLHFRSGYLVSFIAPPWIIVMWMQFATLLRFCLTYLYGRYLVGAALGAVGGPLSFWTGGRLGAVDFGEPAWRSLVVLALVWAAVFPVMLRIAQGGGEVDSPQGYRSFSW